MAQAWSDERVDQIIGTLLRTGVIASAVLVAAGGIVYLAQHGMEAADYRTFRGEPPDLIRLGPIFADALRGSGQHLIQAGLLLLIATPVARVAFSVVAFALQRDRTYVAITLVVLAILIYSLVWGR